MYTDMKGNFVSTLRKSFTLIELIVVIVVIGVLAVIVVPNISSFQDEAKETAMVSDGRNIQTAVDRYHLDHHGQYPIEGDVQPTLGSPKDVDFNLLQPTYLRDLPEHDGVYYQIDHSGVVYHNTVDNPADFTQGDSGLTWTPDEEARGYGIYEVVNGTTGSIAGTGMKLVDEVDGDVGASTPEGYDQEKIYLISVENRYGFKAAPVKEGYVASTAFSQEDFLDITLPNETQPPDTPMVTYIKNYGGSGSDVFNSVQQTDDGGYVAVGYSTSADGDLMNPKGGYDFILAKFDANGNKTWVKNYGGSRHDYFYSVQQTDDGGYVAVGYSQSLNGDITNPKGSDDFVIAKFDSNGNKLWLKNYGGNGSDYFQSVQQTDDGGYVAVGHSNSSNGDITNPKGAFDAIIAKFDANGDKLWLKNYGGSNYEQFQSVQQTDDGGYVAVGYSLSSNGDITNPKGASDAIIAKFDENGNKFWMKNYGGNSSDLFYSVQQTNDGGYVAVGSSHSSNGDITNPKGSGDFILAKFDADGNKVWLKSYGGSSTDLFYSVQQTNDGGYVAVGYSQSSNGDITNPKGASDAIIAKFDANGNKTWLKNYGGNGSDYFHSVQQTADGGYVAVGYSDSTNGDITNPKGNPDFILAKFDESGDLD